MGKWEKTINEYRKQIIEESSKCLYCGAKERLTIDHIVPVATLSRMGIGKFEAFALKHNFAIVCKKCNVEKNDKIFIRLPEVKKALMEIIEVFG